LDVKLHIHCDTFRSPTRIGGVLITAKENWAIKQPIPALVNRIAEPFRLFFAPLLPFFAGHCTSSQVTSRLIPSITAGGFDSMNDAAIEHDRQSEYS
jgi:hypothetical protein